MSFKLFKTLSNTSFNILLRPHSTLRTAFMGKNASLARKSILFTTPIQQAIQPTAPRMMAPLNQIARPVTSSLDPNDPSVSFNGPSQWNRERYVAASQLAIIPLSLLLENPVTDYLLAATLSIHAYWGLECIVTDYIHGTTLPKIAHKLLAVVSILSFIGLCYFNYSDIGLSKAIKKIWSL